MTRCALIAAFALLAAVVDSLIRWTTALKKTDRLL